MDKKAVLEINYYLVAFIDILGQQEVMKEFKGLPDTNNKEQMAQFINIAKNTFGLIDSFHQSFNTYFDAFTNMQKVSPLSKIIKSNDIKFQRFSDGLVIFLSLRTDKNTLPLEGIFGVLAACAGIFLLWLSQGRPLRGGIEIGLGVEMNENEIYGPVVAEAYNIESKIAQYPRLVVGEELKRYLFVHAKDDPNGSDIHSKLRIEFAKICLDLLAQDDDGFAIIDYLGEGFKKNVAKETGVEQFVLSAHEFVVKQSHIWQQQKDSKHAFRYSLLRNYIEARLPIWFDNHKEKGK
jgi:hypothetical protein